MKYLDGGASLRLDSDKCTGCGRCMEVCPHGVYERVEGKAVQTGRDRCMECGACAQNCSYEALEVEAGVGCAFAIINSMLYGGAPSCDCSGAESVGAGGSAGSSGASCC